jgi:hypothetical protein
MIRDRDARLALFSPRFWTVSRLFGEPDRQATPLAQDSIVFRPIRHPVPLSRNVVPVSGVSFERHGAHPMSGNWRQPPTPPSHRLQPADPCWGGRPHGI